MALRYRASAALVKSATMGAFGLWVIGTVVLARRPRDVAERLHDGLPSDLRLLAANASSFALLWAHRHGDSNMRSAWIFTRNDVLGNLAVLLAALGVFGTGTGWPMSSLPRLWPRLHFKAQRRLQVRPSANCVCH
jgi:hypothetical protein